jgi:mono/diheme cytochrome c family protein
MNAGYEGKGCRRVLRLQNIRLRSGGHRVLKGFVAGIVVTLALIALVVYVGLNQGLLIPANADEKPGSFETWAARRSLHATIVREAPKGDNPLQATDANLLAGVKLYGENCAACHGVADGKPSTIAVGLYQHAPQLAADGVEDDPDGVTYWKIAHGIRLTGMPAYGKTLSDTQIWQITLLLKHMDKLTPVADRAWKALKNPVAAAPASAIPPEGGK